LAVYFKQSEFFPLVRVKQFDLLAFISTFSPIFKYKAHNYIDFQQAPAADFWVSSWASACSVWSSCSISCACDRQFCLQNDGLLA